MHRLLAYKAPVASESPWPTNTPSYTPLIPNGAGHGMDSDFGVNTSTTVYIITSLSLTDGGRTSIGTRAYTCSLGHFMNRTDDNRVGLFSVSGLGDHRTNKYLRGNGVALCGQTAPSPGVAFHNYRIRTAGSNQLIWNISNYAGAVNPPDDLDNRDAAQFGDDWDQTVNTNQVWANCTLAGAADESVEMYGALDGATLWQCLVPYPLQYGKGPGEAHATGLIFGDMPINTAAIRCMFMHGNYRMPLYTRGNSGNVLNCLTYNSGTNDTVGYNWNEWLTIGRNLFTNANYPGVGTGNLATRINLEGNLFVRGPDSVNYAQPIWVGSDGSVLENGSRIYLDGNRHHGFTGGSHSTQSNLRLEVTSQTASGLYPGSRETAIYPTGYVPYSVGTTDADLLTFAALMRDTAGSRTKDRAAGIDTYAAAQPYNRINGSGAEGSIIDDLSEINANYAAGGSSGIPTFASNSWDLFDSGDMAGDPLITVEEGRDDVQASGLTWLGEWLQRQHLRWSNY